MALRFFAFALFIIGFQNQQAFACRGEFWPRTAEQAHSDHLVVKANLVHAWSSKMNFKPIMGSEVYFLYEVEVVEVVQAHKKLPLKIGDNIFIHNYANPCERFRPWDSSNEIDLKKYREAVPRLLIVGRWRDKWVLYGGK